MTPSSVRQCPLFPGFSRNAVHDRRATNIYGGDGGVVEEGAAAAPCVLSRPPSISQFRPRTENSACWYRGRRVII